MRAVGADRGPRQRTPGTGLPPPTPPRRDPRLRARRREERSYPYRRLTGTSSAGSSIGTVEVVPLLSRVGVIALAAGLAAAPVAAAAGPWRTAVISGPRAQFVAASIDRRGEAQVA